MLPRGSDVGADRGEVVGRVVALEATGDLSVELRHSQRRLLVVVGEWDGEVPGEADHLGAAVS